MVAIARKMIPIMIMANLLISLLKDTPVWQKMVWIKIAVMYCFENVCIKIISSNHII